MMPEIDGFQLAEQIQQQGLLAGGAMIMLSSVGNLTDVARCKQLGIVRCLIKPTKQSDLRDAVLRALAQAAATFSLTRIGSASRPSNRLNRCESSSSRTALSTSKSPVACSKSVATKSSSSRTAVRRFGLCKTAHSTWCSWMCKCRRWTAMRRPP